MKNKTAYWLELCDDDMLTAKALLESKRLLHMGFFCHLMAEKALKAIIAETTDDIPPRTHDLEKLAILGGIAADLSEDQLALLDDLGPLHIEARYPRHKAKIAATLTVKGCEQLLSKTEEFVCWIKQKLSK